jgi:hypothetical protein
MSNLDAVKKVMMYQKDKSGFVKEPTIKEMADLVVLVLSQVKVIEEAIKAGRLDGKTPIKDVDYISKDSALKMLTQAVNHALNNEEDKFINRVEGKFNSKVYLSEKNRDETVIEAIERINQKLHEVKDGVVTEEEVQRAAQLALGMIELPDFSNLIKDNLDGEAVREVLSRLTGDKRYTVQIADVNGLAQALSQVSQVRSNSSGTIGKQQVYGFIRQAIIDGIITSGGTTTFLGLTDTPATYASQAGKLLAVKTGEDGVEFIAPPSGSGDVVKVGTQVDNQIGVWTGDGTIEGDTSLTFDTTTDTLATPNIDVDNLLNVQKIDFDTTATTDASLGEIRYDADVENFVFGVCSSSIPLNQPFYYVRNNTGATIPKGTPVYASGTVGASGRITIAKMIADGSIEGKYYLGLLHTDVANGADGLAVTEGTLRGIDTSAFSEGDVLYISASTAGALTATEPASPNLSLATAFVIYSNATVGSIALRTMTGVVVDDISDLTVTATELNYVYGVTSAIQTQLDAKQNIDTQLTSLAGLSYTGNSNKVISVNSGETAFELVTPTSGGAFNGARVYKSSGQSITSTLTVVTFDSESYDTDTYHDNLTNNSRLTVPSTGYYRITGIVATDGNTASRAQIRVDGTTLIASLGEGNAGASVQNGTIVSTDYYLTAGQYVELLGAFTSSTNTTTSGVSGTQFFIQKIG